MRMGIRGAVTVRAVRECELRELRECMCVCVCACMCEGIWYGVGLSWWAAIDTDGQ